jgi:hypothetical protein
VIDHVDLRSDNGWPIYENDRVLSLKEAILDNHIGAHWYSTENKMEVITGVSTTGISTVYLNPARDWLDILLTSSEPVEIIIYSLNGAIVDTKITQKADKGKVRIPLASYPKGLLIFQIGNEYRRIIHR